MSNRPGDGSFHDARPCLGANHSSVDDQVVPAPRSVVTIDDLQPGGNRDARDVDLALLCSASVFPRIATNDLHLKQASALLLSDVTPAISGDVKRVDRLNDNIQANVELIGGYRSTDEVARRGLPRIRRLMYAF